MGILEFLKRQARVGDFCFGNSRIPGSSQSLTGAITMRKWQELILNFSMALVAGGILKLVLDKSSVIGSVIIAFCGAYLFVFFAILSIKFDKER